MLLSNFAIPWNLNFIFIFLNISMMLCKILIWWFWFDVTTKALSGLKPKLPYLAIYCKFGYFWHEFATKISFWLFGFLATFLATFENLENMVLNQFKSGFGSISLCFYEDIFAFWKSFDVYILGFQKCFDVGLLRVSKIWLLFDQTFW